MGSSTSRAFYLFDGVGRSSTYRELIDYFNLKKQSGEALDEAEALGEFFGDLDETLDRGLRRDRTVDIEKDGSGAD